VNCGDGRGKAFYASPVRAYRESLGSSPSSIAFSITPADKIRFSVDLPDGKYRLSTGYAWNITQTSRAFMADFLIDSAAQGSTHRQEPKNMGDIHFEHRQFERNLSGLVEFALVFGPETGTATANISDAYIELERIINVVEK